MLRAGSLSGSHMAITIPPPPPLGGNKRG
jgi:hypothetical protein